MNKIYTLTSILICPLVLGGCDAFRNTFGLDHSSPNEWNTAEPSPGLIIPPDFNHRPKLPPPTPGAPNPHVVPDSIKAQKTVFGDDHSVDTSTSSAVGENDLIEKASENQEVTPDIRKKVDEEAQTDSDGSIPGKLIAKIKSWEPNLSTSKPTLPKKGPAADSLQDEDTPVNNRKKPNDDTEAPSS